MKTEKNTQDSIYTSLCSANIPSITSRYIAYQLQIKGNNEKKNYTNKWTNISYMDGENYLVNLHQFPLPDASIKLLK
jgi:hypothetical protein